MAMLNLLICCMDLDVSNIWNCYEMARM